MDKEVDFFFSLKWNILSKFTFEKKDCNNNERITETNLRIPL